MGSIKKAIDSVTGKQDADQIKERLEMLLRLSKSKIQYYRTKLEEQFLNPGEIDRIQIPGTRAIKYIEQYHVASSSSLSKDFKGHLDGAIDSFFSIGDKGSKTKDSVKGGIKNLISGALDVFIGSTEAGESEEHIYFIVPENNALIRADVMLWKYHMSDKTITDNKDTAIAYILCKSVVDHTKVTLDEMIYLISMALSENEYRPISKTVWQKWEGTGATEKLTRVSTKPPKGQIAAYSQIVEVYTMDSSGNPVPIDPEKAAASTIKQNDPDTWDNWRPWMGGSLTKPSIHDVEHYLEELTECWETLRGKLRDDKAQAGKE